MKQERVALTPLYPPGMVTAPDGAGATWGEDIWKLLIPYGVDYHFDPEDIFSCYLEGDPLAMPAAPTLTTLGTGGSLLGNTLYRVQVTAVSSLGETDAATPATITTPATANTATITVTWVPVTGAINYRIYLSTHPLPLLVGTFATSPQTIGTAGTGVAAPTVNTAADEMPGGTLVRVVRRGVLDKEYPLILPETNYANARAFTDDKRLLRLRGYQTTVSPSETIAIQVNGLAVSGFDVNPARSRFRLTGHRERTTI